MAVCKTNEATIASVVIPNRKVYRSGVGRLVQFGGAPIKMTIDRIKALIDELRTQKLNFAPSGNRKAVPGGLPLPPSSTLHEGVTDRGSAGESGPLDIPEQRPSIWDRSVWLF